MYCLFHSLIKSRYDTSTAVNHFSIDTHTQMRSLSQKAEKLFNAFAYLTGKSRYTYFMKVKDSEGNPMYIRPFIFQEILMMAGVWEPYVRSILKDVKKDDIIIDVGAYIGYYAITLGKRASKIFAFEPSPNASSIIERNIEINSLSDKVFLYKKPVSSGKQTLNYIMAAVPTLSGFLSPHEVKKQIGSLEMTTVDLDNTILPQVNRVDWILIDVEGFELEVLKGAAEIIKRYSPKIIIEVWKKNESCIMDMLKTYGYEVRSLFLGNYYAEKIK